MKKLFIISSLIVSILSGIATAETFKIGSTLAHINMADLVELNNRANQLIPADQIIPAADKTVDQNIFEAISNTLADKNAKAQIKQLREDLSSFLVSGGITLISISDEYSASNVVIHSSYKSPTESDLAVFEQMPNINPLLLLMTRSILFKAHDLYLKNSSSYYSFSSPSVWMTLVPIVNIFAPSDWEIRERVQKQEAAYNAFEKCAQSTITEGSNVTDPTCGTKESLELVPSYRKFTAGALLFTTLVKVQISRGKSSTMNISFSEGAYLEQSKDLVDKTEERRIIVMPGAGYLKELSSENWLRDWNWKWR